MESRGSTLTPCKSPSPLTIPVQPDHFYGSENVQLPPSPHSDGKTWLDPADDPLANRGIPVFKPTMEEFRDFESYMNKIECWGKKSGIVKVIPPKDWTESLPSLKDQLKNVKIRSPIEQHMRGHGGLFRQENMEKRKVMSVREWVELCMKDEYRAPGIQEVGLSSRSSNVLPRPKVQRKSRKADTVKAESIGPEQSDVVVKEEPMEEVHSFANEDAAHSVATPPHSEGTPSAGRGPSYDSKGKKKQIVKREEAKPRLKRTGPTREAREASQAERVARDHKFLEVFDPETEWLPPGTNPSDYTPDFCQKLERQYWRNCGLGRPAWYGADTLGSLFTDDTTSWNVARLPSALSRLLPASDQGLPGVNTPYLYFGMWRATFAWHVEDMDLFSINYIHFGAPKFWYAIPQGRATGLEQTMKGYFPRDTSECPQFLRHKSFLASPSILANSSCRPNHLVQQAGEFVITYPRGYHAGFNLGLNCAESVNFALDSWLELGRQAKVCQCVSDSVRIDVDQLLQEREEERLAALDPRSATYIKKSPKNIKKVTEGESSKEAVPHTPTKATSKKRKSNSKEDGQKLKKIKITHSLSQHAPTISIPARPSLASAAHKVSVTLKLGPRPVPELEIFPCCLCVSMNKQGLLKVHEPPLSRKDAVEATGNPQVWMAHEVCASIVPETWVDEAKVEVDGVKEKLVFGVDGIVKDRWNLKCSACTKNKHKAHGAPVQCTKGKCPRAFHVGCAQNSDDQGIMFSVIREVEKEVLVVGPSTPISDPVALRPLDNSNPVVVDQLILDHKSESGPNAVIMDTAPMITVSESQDRPPKFIKKLEVQILCMQHNPAVAAQKKANKNNKIRNDLLALPSMARIKIRVSSGVFEVSLIRVIEETSSVEVLWDKGLKKEFKWGSVVFGSTDGPVLQKPSEMAPPEPNRPTIGVLPVPTYPSMMAATHVHAFSAAYPASLSSTTATQSGIPSGSTLSANQPMYPPRTGAYDYWTYASQYSGQMPYSHYNGYYTPVATGSSQSHNPYAYLSSTYNTSHYRQHLNWQQPYKGPPSTQTQTASSSEKQNSAQSSKSSTPAPKTPASACQQDEQPQERSLYTSLKTSDASTSELGQQSDLQIGALAPSEVPSDSTPQAVFNELATLSTLPPEQIAEVLRNNSQLRDFVWAAVDQAKKTSVPT